MSSMKFEPIKTSRLVIVEYAPEYSNEVFAYRSLPEIYKPYTAKMDSPQALAEYFEEQITEFDNPEGGYSVFLILLNSKVIGEITVSFWDHNNEINEIGFAVHPDYQKQGFASEALKAFFHLRLFHYNWDHGRHSYPILNRDPLSSPLKAHFLYRVWLLCINGSRPLGFV